METVLFEQSLCVCVSRSLVLGSCHPDDELDLRSSSGTSVSAVASVSRSFLGNLWCHPLIHPLPNVFKEGFN